MTTGLEKDSLKNSCGSPMDPSVGTRCVVDEEKSRQMLAKNDALEARTTRGARKRKGKPVKIYKEDYAKDSGSEDLPEEEETKGKGRHSPCENNGTVCIGRVGKRNLFVKQTTASPKARRTIGTNEGGASDDDGDESLPEGEQEVIACGYGGRTKTRLHPRTKASPGWERGASTSGSRTAYRKNWCQNRPYHHCPTCEYKTRDKDTYKSHLAKHDPNAERFTCEICSKSFRNKRSFQWHLRVHRTPEQLHRCGLCDYRTPQKSIWLRHLNEVHKVDSDGNHLNDDVKCGECSFACVTEYRLKLHRKAKHCEKQHKCNECSYSAISKCDVEKHISIRHRNERRHLCFTCGYLAKTVSALNDHARGHLGLKAFVCDVCGKAYARGDKLKIHLRTHSDNMKPYMCPYCVHACRRKDHLQVHLKRVHKKALDKVLGLGNKTNESGQQSSLTDALKEIDVRDPFAVTKTSGDTNDTQGY